MAEKKLSDQSKELTSLLFMATHMEMSSTQMLGEDDPTTRAIKVARQAVMKAIVEKQEIDMNLNTKANKGSNLSNTVSSSRMH
ncbi:MAG: hypothetical protein CMK07_15735 [Ponticaulis sp.]|nr:hypothetical protein [Ponticaulis sp.]